MTGSARLGCVLLLGALLVGCNGDPEPTPDDQADVETPDAPAEDTPAPEAAKPEEKPKTPTISGDDVADVKMSGSRTFAAELKELKANDVVEVELRQGGVTRGSITTLRRRLLVLSSARPGESRESAILTRLRPKQVKGVKLLFRPSSDQVEVSTGGPLSPEETWLERYADAEVLGKDPATLWDKRFRRSMPLVVKQSFTIRSLTFKERTGKAYFARNTRPSQLQALDQIKVAGVVLGYTPKIRGRDACIGLVYLYLVRRGRTVWTIHSLERLHPGDLTKKSVRRWVKYDVVTLVMRRPGESRPFKIRRIRAKHARIYQQHLEYTPARPEIRRLRAKGGMDQSALISAEARVRAIYNAMGLRKDADLDRPLILSFRLPVAYRGGIHLLPYQREIGLD